MRVCSAGCLRVVPDNVRYCDECKPAITDDGIRGNERTEIYDAEIHKQASSTRWQKLRLLIIRRNPFCQMCDQAPSEIVDHVIPASVAIEQARASKRWPLDKWAGYYLSSNLQGLCRKCHAIKTAQDKAHQGEWTSILTALDAQPKKRFVFY